jgi:hypothetical protein
MIHIVFEQANVEALSKAFELETSMGGDIMTGGKNYWNSLPIRSSRI